MIVSLIAAMAKNRVIGRGAAIPWHLPEDLRRFRELTWGHVLIMGRKTFESIGRPLPGRRTIILTRQLDYRVEGCQVARDLEEALAACAGEAEVFVCGGGEVYRQALNIADRIYLTILCREIAGDVVFPEIPENFLEVGREGLSGPEICEFVVFKKSVPLN